MSRKSLGRTFPNSSHPRLAPACLALVLVAVLAAPAAGQEDLACGFPYVVQHEAAHLHLATEHLAMIHKADVGVGSAPYEINAMGFRKTATEDLLYAVWLHEDGNYGLVKIDDNGTAYWVGYPADLPWWVRFDAGDVSSDGSKMYVNYAGFSPLYIVDLDAMTTTEMPITGGVGYVHDWAYNRMDGLLYGADSSHGQLATLDPSNGVRVDFSVEGLPGMTGLPKGVAYGGAWFDNRGYLFVYRNDGWVYEIDVSVPKIRSSHQTDATARNDAAICLLDGVLTGGPHAEGCPRSSPDCDCNDVAAFCFDHFGIFIPEDEQGYCWCLYFITDLGT